MAIITPKGWNYCSNGINKTIKCRRHDIIMMNRCDVNSDCTGCEILWFISSSVFSVLFSVFSVISVISEFSEFSVMSSYEQLHYDKLTNVIAIG